MLKTYLQKLLDRSTDMGEYQEYLPTLNSSFTFVAPDNGIVVFRTFANGVDTDRYIILSRSGTTNATMWNVNGLASTIWCECKKGETITAKSVNQDLIEYLRFYPIRC